ncbi:MAG TPA: exodeoxyribonuclease VII small subunit [Chthoniobacterales bacterium]|nr:exodeoxyribonuclease VII small subunit [Chthoniobacterales bacterium]
MMSETIESALTKLEAIVAGIESNPPPLETLIERYEEGVKLLKICQEKLSAAEQRIEMITHNAQGEITLQPFSS